MGHPEGRGRATNNVLKKAIKVKYFCMIPFASSRQWSKQILGILSSMSDRPKGRERATPIFRLVELLTC